MASVSATLLPQPWRQRWQQQHLQKTLFIISVLTPMTVIFLLFWIYPIVRGIWGSFTLWRAFNPVAPWVGARHYEGLLTDPIFLKALQNTFYFALLYLPAAIVVALVVALAVEAAGSGRNFFRMVYFIPVVTSTIATALIWTWLYQPAFGLFNQLLQMVGLPPQSYLKSTSQAMPAIVLYTLWKNLGFNMVLFIAGLSSIDPSFYDAAKVDGANRWQRFWRITLPLLEPTLVFVFVTGVIGALQVFGPIYVMSAGGDGLPGGPANATMVVSVYQWLMAFRELELGYGSAMGVILFVLILLLTLAQMRFLRTRWEY
ncbi:MAG: sugar ABC transporter permease [Caldilinea sp. CFX5]|nr:sugar ABC transporter permease [Caldilinea sp. CFX5]